jgi:hypothetical protein
MTSAAYTPLRSERSVVFRTVGNLIEILGIVIHIDAVMCGCGISKDLVTMVRAAVVACASVFATTAIARLE